MQHKIFILHPDLMNQRCKHKSNVNLTCENKLSFPVFHVFYTYLSLRIILVFFNYSQQLVTKESERYFHNYAVLYERSLGFITLKEVKRERLARKWFHKLSRVIPPPSVSVENLVKSLQMIINMNEFSINPISKVHQDSEKRRDEKILSFHGNLLYFKI